MNSAAYHKISVKHRLWSTLDALRHKHHIDWERLTKKELLGLVMEESRGHLNPQMVRDAIDEL